MNILKLFYGVIPSHDQIIAGMLINGSEYVIPLFGSNEGFGIILAKVIFMPWVIMTRLCQYIWYYVGGTTDASYFTIMFIGWLICSPIFIRFYISIWGLLRISHYDNGGY